jgi:predicted MPP superfamily phosphohydrolase
MGEYHLPRGGRSPMILYVSRGIGMEGGVAPRARLLSRPEIILWTIKGADEIAPGQGSTSSVS